METYIGEHYRVRIKVLDSKQNYPFLIMTEQKVSDGCLPWEVEDGWRACIVECAATMEEATKKYEQQITSERRYH